MTAGKLVLACDPGITGAFALLDESGPMPAAVPDCSAGAAEGQRPGGGDSARSLVRKARVSNPGRDVTISRRSFLKFAAASTAVAIVPVQIVEAIAPMPAPVKVLDAVSRRTWYINQRSITWGRHRTEIDLILHAGSCRLDLGLLVHQGAEWLNVYDELEIDLRLVDGRPRVFVGDQVVNDVRRMSFGIERPMIDFTSWSDDTRRFVLGFIDDEPMRQLTAYKQLRGGGA